MKFWESIENLVLENGSLKSFVNGINIKITHKDDLPQIIIAIYLVICVFLLALVMASLLKL